MVFDSFLLTQWVFTARHGRIFPNPLVCPWVMLAEVEMSHSNPPK